MKHYRHYLYGHHCTVFTDNEALKSLLNTLQTSGKLAPWGMALQELNQRHDFRLLLIIKCLENGDLPRDEKAPPELVLGRSQFTLIGGVLYHVEPDKTLRVIPPTSDQSELFKEVHKGPFSGHLREAKIYSQLCRQYWWPRCAGKSHTGAILVCRVLQVESDIL